MATKTPKSDVVTWIDADGRKHTGSRDGEAYRKHLLEQESKAKSAKKPAEKPAEATAPAVSGGK